MVRTPAAFKHEALDSMFNFDPHRVFSLTNVDGMKDLIHIDIHDSSRLS